MLPSRETAPFIYDVTAQTLKGAAAGLLLGFVFFKSSGTRRFCMYYGAGVGLGMSYQQVKHLYGKLTQHECEDIGALKIEDMQRELEMI